METEITPPRERKLVEESRGERGLPLGTISFPDVLGRFGKNFPLTLSALDGVVPPYLQRFFHPFGILPPSLGIFLSFPQSPLPHMLSHLTSLLSLFSFPFLPTARQQRFLLGSESHAFPPLATPRFSSRSYTSPQLGFGINPSCTRTREKRQQKHEAQNNTKHFATKTVFKKCVLR